MSNVFKIWSTLLAIVIIVSNFQQLSTIVNIVKIVFKIIVKIVVNIVVNIVVKIVKLKSKATSGN